jgi:hypothetical protein
MDIVSLNVISGRLPVKVRGLVAEWAEAHAEELVRMWQSGEFHRVEPLVK